MLPLDTRDGGRSAVGVWRLSRHVVTIVLSTKCRCIYEMASWKGRCQLNEHTRFTYSPAIVAWRCCRAVAAFRVVNRSLEDVFDGRSRRCCDVVAPVGSLLCTAGFRPQRRPIPFKSPFYSPFLPSIVSSSVSWLVRLVG